MPYSAQDFYTSIDVLAELDNGTQVIIEIQVHHQNFFHQSSVGLLMQPGQSKSRKNSSTRSDTHRELQTHRTGICYRYCGQQLFQDDLAFHSFSMSEDTTGEALTITNNG